MLPPFLYNLIILSPLLLAAVGFLYAFDRYDQNRRAAINPPPPASDPNPEVNEQTPSEQHNHNPTNLHAALEDASDDEDHTGIASETAPFLDRPPTPSDSDSDSDSSPEDHHADPAAGPSTTNTTRRTTRPPKKLGAKKLKSLERRDRQRAYHEWLRSRSELQNASLATREAEDREIAAENARRRGIEEERILARKEKEREERVILEERRMREEREAVGRVIDGIKGKKAVELEILGKRVKRDREWVEGVLRREVLPRKPEDGEVRCIIGGWWVCLGTKEMEGFWRVVEERGRMDWSEIGNVLEEVLKEPKKGFW